jgi:hypothetical protein
MVDSITGQEKPCFLNGVSYLIYAFIASFFFFEKKRLLLSQIVCDFEGVG